MSHCIARVLEPLLRFLGTAPSRPASPPGIRPYRPLGQAREQRAEVRRQRARRRALWLAVHGIDIGPRLIHGRVVTA
ncbi:hypothetical protein [Streptomyces virginiae]|uniref:hypothetical protein n=1 Tax=Streptomyces virginiae TaxID=1961 RepID=UPI002251B691|nr:hypothetical protein [Streptomyces virginiae]MCX4962803.1 hypothetical protein [Streptomyces virginiae]